MCHSLPRYNGIEMYNDDKCYCHWVKKKRRPLDKQDGTQIEKMGQC